MVLIPSLLGTPCKDAGLKDSSSQANMPTMYGFILIYSIYPDSVYILWFPIFVLILIDLTLTASHNIYPLSCKAIVKLGR